MNVTLNKDSWHFKIYNKVVGKTPPKTLCPYFWTLVGIFVLSPLIIFIVVISKIIDGYNWLSNKLSFSKKTEKVDERPYEVVMAEMRKKWDEEDRKEMIRVKRWNKIGDIMLILFKWVFIPFVCVGLIYVLYLNSVKVGWLTVLIHIGICLGLIAAILGWIWFWDKFSGRIFSPIGRGLIKLNPVKWSIVQIIGGMIYSAYKKACPIINWEGETKETNENAYN